MEIVRGAIGDHFFQRTATLLIQDHGATEEPSDILAFLEKAPNEEISLRIGDQAGVALIQDKDNAAEVVDLIRENKNPFIRRDLIDGALSF